MSELKDRIDRLAAEMDRAVNLERSLAARLEDQAHALRRGAIEEIYAACTELERVRAELLAVGGDLMSQCAALTGRPDASFDTLIAELPPTSTSGLSAAHDRFVAARASVRWSIRKNAAFSRSALDALADMKAALRRAASGDSATRSGATTTALDTRV